MLSPHRLPGLLCAALLCLLGIATASAQWLVYEVKFTPDQESVNFSFYTGAYIIAPTQGGAATIVLTTEENGSAYYAVSEAGGKFFVAANQRTKKAVFSAVALRGSAQAFYSAAGYLNRSLLLDSPTGARSWRVAEKIEGRFMAADDEGGLGPAPDGSFGVSGSARMTGLLREDLTANATLANSTLTGATSYVIELLERYGYQPDSGETSAAATASAAAADADLLDPITADGDTLIDPSLFPQATLGQGP